MLLKDGSFHVKSPHAEKYGCQEIITEDLNNGQLYRGMVAVNPFV